MNEERINQIIVALDVSTSKEAFCLIEKLPSINCFKVGWQLFANEGLNIIKLLDSRGISVFLDLKIDDIPYTVENAVRTLTQFECVKFFSFQGDESTLQACRIGSHNASTKFLFVPTLSSRSSILVVLHEPRVYKTLIEGAAGVVVSGYNQIRFMEARYNTLIVAPGIRCNALHEDHLDPTTPQEAFGAGADYIVIGREITEDDDPEKALEKCL